MTLKLCKTPPFLSRFHVHGATIIVGCKVDCGARDLDFKNHTHKISPIYTHWIILLLYFMFGKQSESFLHAQRFGVLITILALIYSALHGFRPQNSQIPNKKNSATAQQKGVKSAKTS